MIRLEIYGIIVVAFALALFLALISYSAADLPDGSRLRPIEPANWLGPVGARIADLFLAGFGLGSFLLALLFGWLGLAYILGRRARMGRVDLLGGLFAFLSLIVLADIAGPDKVFTVHEPGGGLGHLLRTIFEALLSTPGTVLVFVALGLVSVVMLTRRSIVELARAALGGGSRFVRWLIALMRKGDADLEEEIGPEDEADEADADEADEAGPRVVIAGTPAEASAPRTAATSSTPIVATPTTSPTPPTAPAAVPPAAPAAAAPAPIITAPPARPPVSPGPLFGAAAPAPTPAPKPAAPPAAAPPAAAPPAAAPPDEDDGIRIVESEAMRKPPVIIDSFDELAEADEVEGAAHDLEGVDPDDDEDDEDGPRIATRPEPKPAEKPFVLPSLAMLDYKPPETTTFDRELLKRNAQILEAKLLDYKVKGKVTEIHPGPVITMYEFLPAPGIKISSIANLADDLAMALSAIRIRIVAPIPGKNVVGIEVPNAARETVWLKEILSDDSYARNRSRMTLALGKDITGNPTSMDLAKAPHLLVAGSTGSGKSVAINSFVVSLLYKAEPSDVRLIMVDPKMLELSIYEGIPHLLLPVVTDPKQASTALKWAVKEMTRRYGLMADMGVRNLAGYNAKVTQLLEEPGHPLPERLRLAKAKREAKSGKPDPAGVILDCSDKPIERLPCIVVIIDELADLMMVASKEVETCIARLAQMARASGIHLILATQRPSVDVLTGLIKANFPTRISFQVASKTDSRTILDRNGAEALLGMGDMLFMPPGSGGIKRVHGCYVSEEEVHRVVAHLKEQGSPDYDMGILVSDEDEDGGGGKAAEPAGDEHDALYDQAVRIAAEIGSISTSLLQRKLKIGYNRAARIVELMEERGIVGPSDGTSRAREVFIERL